jgi:hypothetical protein
MPTPDYKIPMLPCQLFGPTKVLKLQTHGFPEGNLALDAEHRFATTLADVHVDRAMVVAVEEATEAFVGENSRHDRSVLPGQVRLA